MDMTVLLISEPTLMPDAQVTVMKNVKANEDKTTVKNILEDINREIEASNKDSQIEQTTYLNSFIVELEIENPPEDFNLHLLITPDIDIVSTCIFQWIPRLMTSHAEVLKIVVIRFDFDIILKNPIERMLK